MVRQLMTLTLALLVSQAQAVEVKLTADKDFVEVIHQGKLVKIERIQDQDHTLEGGFAKTSRKCPPFCIQPMSAAEGVTTIGQLEMFDFIENELLDEAGIIVETPLIDVFIDVGLEKVAQPGCRLTCILCVLFLVRSAPYPTK